MHTWSVLISLFNYSIIYKYVNLFNMMIHQSLYLFTHPCHEACISIERLQATPITVKCRVVVLYELLLQIKQHWIIFMAFMSCDICVIDHMNHESGNDMICNGWRCDRSVNVDLFHRYKHNILLETHVYNTIICGSQGRSYWIDKKCCARVCW